MWALLTIVGCTVPKLEPSEWGSFRYFADVPGTAPLRLIPPMTDRDGNIYVLFGDRQRAESKVYVGHRYGGWSGGCQAHEGIFGVRGFVGRAQSEAWYWSGEALVEVDGASGACESLLDSDPISGTDLNFVAVVPWVQETPSRTLLLGMIQGASDPLPFHAVIDLDNEIYRSVRPFERQDAETVAIVGTGADIDTERGYIVSTVATKAFTATYVLFIDADGESVGTVQLDEVLDANAIMGFAQGAGGVGAAVLEDGRLLTFNTAEATVDSLEPIIAEGLVKWDDELYVSGVLDGQAVIARILGPGELASPQVFTTSLGAQNTLEGNIDVLDERSDPTRDAVWSNPTSAFASFPFLSPHPLDHYTNESTGWLVAGPSFATGIEDSTALAFAPVGIEVP